MTERCALLVYKLCLQHTFSDVSAIIGCNETTVRSIYQKESKRINGDENVETLPDWIGLSNLHVGGSDLLLVIDVSARRLIDVLPSNDKSFLVGWFKSAQKANQFRRASLDMSSGYPEAISSVFPGISLDFWRSGVETVAADCFEATVKRVGMAGQKSRKSRRIVPVNLSDVQPSDRREDDSQIEESLRLKQSFLRNLKIPRDFAEHAIDLWLKSVPSHLQADWNNLIGILSLRRKDVLSSIGLEDEEAYVESIKNTARRISNEGRGYSFKVIRSRLLSQDPIAAVSLNTSIGNSNDHGYEKSSEESAIACCASCRGPFLAGSLARGLLSAVVPGQHRRDGLLCGDCWSRLGEHPGSDAAGPRT